MYETTQAQKNTYLGKMKAIRSKANDMVPVINNILLEYGAVFYRKTRGEFTENYATEKLTEAKEKIVITVRDKFTQIIDMLNEEKNQYLDKCFDKKSTEDPIELNFVSKELELMDRKELQEFFESNCLDKNMIRLFDIELKRRSKSSDTMEHTVAASLQALKDQYNINDTVTKQYDACIKEFIGARSVSSSMIVFPQYDENDNMSVKSVTLNDMFNEIHAKSAWGIPKKDTFNVLELVK